ncbi:hypothetical protein GCM10027062_13510 [Nocardioides hungaricus]
MLAEGVELALEQTQLAERDGAEHEDARQGETGRDRQHQWAGRSEANRAGHKGAGHPDRGHGEDGGVEPGAAGVDAEREPEDHSSERDEGSRQQLAFAHGRPTPSRGGSAHCAEELHLWSGPATW